MFRRPTVPASEIAWRWAFGGALCFLSAVLFLEYASSRTVDPGSDLLLRSGQPILIWGALQHIFSGSAIRFTGGLVIISLALLIFWMAAASLGRVASLEAIGEEFKAAELSSDRRASPLRSLLGLNLLRAAALLAAVVATAGALMAANSIWAHSKASVVDATRLWFASLCLIWLAWAVVNWFLATASVFVVSERRAAFAALESLASFCQEHLGPVIIVGIWFGVAHLASLILAFTFGFMALSLLGILGPAPVVVIECLIVLIYFAIADCLYTGRLAAYVALIGGCGIVSPATNDVRSGPSAGQIDQSELILSDVPVC